MNTKFKLDIEFDINQVAVLAGLKPPSEMDLIVFTRLFNAAKAEIATELLSVLLEDSSDIDDLMEDAGFMPKQDEAIVNDPDEDESDSGSFDADDSYDDGYYQDEEPDYDEPF
jgi:hypothetical protein